jgi:hypothetical protein
MNLRLLTSKQVAEKIGVDYQRLLYAIRVHRIVDPVRIGTMRLYTADDVIKLVKHFSDRQTRQTQATHSQ